MQDFNRKNRLNLTINSKFDSISQNKTNALGLSPAGSYSMDSASSPRNKNSINSRKIIQASPPRLYKQNESTQEPKKQDSLAKQVGGKINPHVSQLNNDINRDIEYILDEQNENTNEVPKNSHNVSLSILRTIKHDLGD